MARQKAKGMTLLVGTTVLTIVLHLLHELAHALTAIAFGVSGSMGSNTVSYSSDISDSAALWINIAGPGLMLVFALLAFRAKSAWAPTVLFIVFFQRAMAALFTALGSPNDEARIGAILGIGTWPVFAATLALSGILLALRFSKMSGKLAWFAISYVGFNMGIAAVVFGDDVLPRFAF